MPIFCRNFNFDLVTRVWDIFIFEDIKIVYRVALGLIKFIEAKIIDSDFEDNLALIHDIPELIEVESLMKVVWQIPLHREDIKKFEKEFDLSYYS